MTLDHSTLCKHQQNLPALRTNVPHAANPQGRRGRRARGGDHRRYNRLNERSGASTKREGSPTPRASADFYVLSRALKQLSHNYLRNGSRCLWKRYKYVSSSARVLVSLRFPSNAIIAIDCLAVDNYGQLFSVYMVYIIWLCVYRLLQ